MSDEEEDEVEYEIERTVGRDEAATLLRKLADDPYPRPDSGSGDKEKLVIEGEELYRLHIGRTHTAFYDVLESDGEVRVIEIVDIDEAHKRYGFD